MERNCFILLDGFIDILEKLSQDVHSFFEGSFVGAFIHFRV